MREKSNMENTEYAAVLGGIEPRLRWLRRAKSAIATPTVVVLALAMVFGCSASGSSTKPSNSGGNDTGAAGAAGSGGAFIDMRDGSVFDPANCTSTSPNADSDGDGYTVAQGDCNDCSRQVNPGAYDFPDNGVDEDCNGVVDDEPEGCDVDLPLEGLNPLDAAKALGICRYSTPDAQGKERTWGVIHAAYVFADGSTESATPSVTTGCTKAEGANVGEGAPPNELSYGILPTFGVVTPRAGSSMLALSTGIARQGVNGDSPEKADMCTVSATPDGFPTPSKQACPGVTIDDLAVARDPVALELDIRTPTNAKSFSFDFNFYTFEYPDWVCSKYNDYFVALLYSSNPETPKNRNISLDIGGNHVSVNNGFLEVCAPGTYNNKSFLCPRGVDELVGTGFENHGATGWLQTTAPITPGEDIKLRFAIWDMGDGKLDSTVLVDNVVWSIEEGDQNTFRPPK